MRTRCKKERRDSGGRESARARARAGALALGLGRWGAEGWGAGAGGLVAVAVRGTSTKPNSQLDELSTTAMHQ
eukprot:scaffold281549_cov36-Tisochrysis_lutea.AAC.1